MLKDVFEYLNQSAPVLFLTIDEDGRILTMNQYAADTFGQVAEDAAFNDLVNDFQSTFDLNTLVKSPEKKHLLNVNTADHGVQSFMFTFKHVSPRILIFGHLDTISIELMQSQMISLNQDLGNLNRELQKKNAELKSALDHVKTLQGIIPICMHCHKIRNDQQIWDRLEAYLSEHTNAQLSHGICPECMKKYYSDLDDNAP